MDLKPTGQLSPTGLGEEEDEVSHHETGVASQDPDRQLSEEQNYRETVRRVIYGCHQVPELCPPHWGVDILFLLFPASGVPLGFQTF